DDDCNEIASTFRAPPSPATAVCTENLNPNVVVMQSTKDRVRVDDSGTLNGTKGRCIFVQRPVGSDVVVIGNIGSQDPAQMGFASDDEMIETLAPDRSDQPFSEAILPRRSRCDGLSRIPMARKRRVTTVP